MDEGGGRREEGGGRREEGEGKKGGIGLDWIPGYRLAGATRPTRSVHFLRPIIQHHTPTLHAAFFLLSHLLYSHTQVDPLGRNLGGGGVTNSLHHYLGQPCAHAPLGSSPKQLAPPRLVISSKHLVFLACGHCTNRPISIIICCSPLGAFSVFLARFCPSLDYAHFPPTFSETSSVNKPKPFGFKSRLVHLVSRKGAAQNPAVWGMGADGAGTNGHTSKVSTVKLNALAGHLLSGFTRADLKQMARVVAGMTMRSQELACSFMSENIIRDSEMRLWADVSGIK